MGYTEDLKLRFEQHCKGQVDSTKHRRPLEMIYYEACLDKENAKKREKHLKTHYGRLFKWRGCVGFRLADVLHDG